MVTRQSNANLRRAIRRTKIAKLTKRLFGIIRNPGRIPTGLARRRESRLPPTPIAAEPTPRLLSRPERLGLIVKDLDLNGAGLEIGPSHNPLLLKSQGHNIKIADHLDRSGLIAKYEGYRPTGRIEDVDFVLGPGSLTEYIGEQFDFILASHVAEHTVCLICFLNDCEKLLKPEGVLSLALPDRRYCFDHFRERTALGRVVDVHDSGPSVHTRGSVLEHNLNMVDKAESVSWFDGAPGKVRWRVPLWAVLERAKKATDGEYVDTHNWVMTPSHCRLLLHDLHLLGFVGMREKSFTHTIDHEFFITLSKDGAGPDVSRNDLVKRSASEGSVQQEVVFSNESPAG